MFELVVRAIITDKKGRVLLVKRVKDPEKGKWSLPGGKIEFGESAVDAVIREIKEELDLTFTPHFLRYQEYFDPQLHSIIFYFTGLHTGTMEVKEDESSDAIFFTKAEIIKMDMIAWRHQKLIIEYLNA